VNRREFSAKVRLEIVHRAMDGRGRIVCEGCGQILAHKRYEIDHTIAEALVIDKSAPLTALDGQLLGACCHRGEGGKTAKDATAIAKSKRAERKHLRIKQRSTFPKPPPGYRYDWKLGRLTKETA
jgi:hypothetical protein